MNNTGLTEERKHELVDGLGGTGTSGHGYITDMMRERSYHALVTVVEITKKRKDKEINETNYDQMVTELTADIYDMLGELREEIVIDPIMDEMFDHNKERAIIKGN